MKKCISASSALLAAAMMVTLSFGCGEGIEGETGSQSAELIELTNGQCNSISARSLGLSQQCNKFGCSEAECGELADVFNELFDPGINCGALFAAGELKGLGGSALIKPNGDPGPIQEVLCGANFACDETCAGLRGIGLCFETDACNP